MLIVSNVLLWVFVALLTVAVFALARQIRAIREKLNPAGVAGRDDGPKSGDRAPMVAASTLEGGVVNIGAVDPAPVLLLFVTADGALCRKIVPIAMVLARSEGLRLIFVGGGQVEDYAVMAKRFSADGFDFALSAQAIAAYRVGVRPEAVLIAPDGTISARGSVKSREHLHSLIIAGTRGYEPDEAFSGPLIRAVND